MSFAAKKAGIWISADKSPDIGQYITRYEITYLLHVCVQMYIGFFIVFAWILSHFYLVDDIYDIKSTFSYQYFILYKCPMNIRYVRVSLISPPISDIWYEKPSSDMIPISDI